MRWNGGPTPTNLSTPCKTNTDDLDSLDDESLDSEASAALLPMVEGEAVLVQNLYLLGGY